MFKKAGFFLSVGVVGFVVDAATFFCSTVWLQVDFVPARVFASLLAATVTWQLNRTLAFRSGKLANVTVEYLRYLAASSIGALANLAVAYPISRFDAVWYHLPAYVAGAASGLVVNFLLYDNLVFSGARSTGKK
ncbi:GtrA family protein [Bosea sp. 124]|uniref:GtrA family protein n=1 Tax=Bosea sp. 124 TaxID=2135642 RepID=UPI000D34076B|nr:GtrA family protein [Bosea sp. 124]PTM41495.1 putative flippase GtrA [Bosea sp. 124]